MRGDVALPVDAAEAAQSFAENVGFVAQLGLIRNVLVVAAAADAEMRAGRDGAIRGRLDEPLQAGADELLLLLDGRGGDALGGKHKRNEDGGAFVVRQTFAAVN